MQGFQVEHFGTFSRVAGAALVDPTKIAHVLVEVVWPTTADHPSLVKTMFGPVTPEVTRYSLAGKDVVYDE